MKPDRIKYYPLIVVIILFLLFPALFINLGLLPLFADEATRAVVALEMEYSGNLITPTINGEFYFNKPPLYNWILLAFFKISGSHSEFIVRLPMIISLLVYGLVIFLTTKKYTGRRNAFLSALLYITSGRILFYDSMLGLIDTTYSLLIFINFILIYELIKKEKFRSLFLLSYFITAITFLMKGLPSVVFQGLTIIMAFVWQKRTKLLFGFSHFAGILLFLSITGSYYYLLWRDNPTEKYFEVLFAESAKRTFIEHGWKETFINLFTFPFYQLYHLLPWSLLILLAFQKRFYKVIKENSFLTYIALVFLVNIPVYWVSVETYPRYMFMLYPLLLIILLVNYTRTEATDPTRKIIDNIFSGILILMATGLILATFFADLQADINEKPVFISLAFFTAFITVYFRKFPSLRPELLVILLLITRIAFNITILPERYSDSRRVMQKEQALTVAQLSKDKELRLQKLATFSHETTFYISSERGEILKRYRPPFIPGPLYIFDDRDPLRPGEEVTYRFETRWKNHKLRLSQMKDE